MTILQLHTYEDAEILLNAIRFRTQELSKVKSDNIQFKEEIAILNTIETDLDRKLVVNHLDPTEGWATD